MKRYYLIIGLLLSFVISGFGWDNYFNSYYTVKTNYIVTVIDKTVDYKKDYVLHLKEARTSNVFFISTTNEKYYSTIVGERIVMPLAKYDFNESMYENILYRLISPFFGVLGAVLAIFFCQRLSELRNFKTKLNK